MDHTFRTKLKDTIAPPQVRNTIIRAELYSPGGKNSDTARILNSSVIGGREKGELDIAMFDIVKFKGKNVEDKPYKEKLKMLEEVNKAFPDIKMPFLAKTEKEKKEMFSRIMSGKDKLTSEGIVVYKDNESVPYKVKKKNDYDAEIIGTFPAKKNTKYSDNAVGGFIVLPEGSSTPIKVGSGLDDNTRKDAYLNPSSYIGQWAQIQSQTVHKSGKHQAPIFKDIRAEKMMSKAASALSILAKYN